MQSVSANLQSLAKGSCQQAVADGMLCCQPLCNHRVGCQSSSCAVLFWDSAAEISSNLHGLR